MKNLFNENMSSVEAGYAYWSAIDGKAKEEIAAIDEEYAEYRSKMTVFYFFKIY